MPVPRIDDLRATASRHGAGSRLWAEWCFFRVCIRHVRIRMLLMALVLLLGTLAFRTLGEDQGERSIVRSTYATFSLIFGEPPGAFPDSWLLEILYFLIPILGLSIFIEGIVDFSLILRDRRRFERSWCNMLASSFRNHIVVVGLDRLGYRTFLTLRRLGEPVVVIAPPEDTDFLEEIRRDGSPLFIGDARQEALLEDAHIAGARTIVVASRDDLANLEIALDARRLNPGIRVVLRMSDQNIADKIEDGFNIHLAMSPSALAAPTFATCAVAPATVNSCIVGDQLVAMQRWLVRSGGPLTGRTIAEVMSDHRITVVEHHRPAAEPVICPPPGTRFEAGDGLLVQGPVDVLEGLREAVAGGG